MLLLNGLGDRLTDHYENWYIHVVVHGGMGFTAIVILTGLLGNIYF